MNVSAFSIIANGEILNTLQDILIKKAETGVKVYIIYDHAGSLYLFHSKSIKWLEQNGVKIIKNAPINKSLLRGRTPFRLHRKDVVIDGKIAYTGGINIADEWINSSQTIGFYNDVQIRVSGPAASVIAAIFAKNWFSSTYKEKILTTGWTIISKKRPSSSSVIANSLAKQKSYLIVSNQEPGGGKSAHKTILLSLINQAKNRIWISTPYFIPPGDIIEALVNAAERGVDVRVLIPGKTDKAFVLDITRLNLQSIYHAGGKIFELNSSFNHGKVTIIDDDISAIGTTNYDYRALYIDQQTLVVSKNEKLVDSLNNWWEWNFQHAVKWQVSILQFKNPVYIGFLNIMKLMTPIL